MIDEVYNEVNEKMDKTIDSLKKNLVGIRAGRANPHLLDKIVVNYYGVPTPLNQLANISAPEPRLLVVSPWDPKIIPDIEKEIMKSDLGINPTNDGKVIRLVLPELTEERRKELAKIVRKFGEDAKVAVRMIRREAIDRFRKMKKNSEITEDDLRDAEKDIQKLTDQHIEKIDELIGEKEKEIMEV